MDCPPPPPPPPPSVALPVAEAFNFLSQAEASKAGHLTEARERLKSLEVPLSASGLFDTSGSAPLEALNWDDAMNVTASHGGSSGVFFVQFKDGLRTVIKGSKDPAKEIFMCRVARRLGLAVPHVRIVCYSDLEYRKIKDCVKRLCEGELLWVAKKQLLKPQILVMEFVEGVGLLQMTPELCTNYFSVSANPKDSRTVLRALGRVMGLDACCNNWDRIPLVHDNDGNFDNVILQYHTTVQVIGVDNSMTSVKRLINNAQPNPQYPKYVAKLKELVTQLLVAEECQMVSRLREAILMGTGIPLTSLEGLEIQCGIREILCRFVAFGNHLQEELDTVRGMVKPAADWEGVYSRDVEGIDLSFLTDLIEVIRPHVKTLEKLCD